ncbi:hypothetical protein N658DRAFT_217161 [Parathielavia hyrcaniae]|uniref:Uncharacterized protein n=1 Tax=Parathielavia hyrcaniae TaxID=113614 RepID=A0AAN6PVK7_9PEZI|nr:hypothetical protein N658DRAFT_217161 [Parathielavia hyrcaniae]
MGRTGSPRPDVARLPRMRTDRVVGFGRGSACGAIGQWAPWKLPSSTHRPTACSNGATTAVPQYAMARVQRLQNGLPESRHSRLSSGSLFPLGSREVQCHKFHEHGETPIARLLHWHPHTSPDIRV